MELNQIVYSIGIDLKCKKVVSKYKIVEFLNPILNEHGYDCVIESGGGLLIKSYLKTLYASRKEAVNSIAQKSRN